MSSGTPEELSIPAPLVARHTALVTNRGDESEGIIYISIVRHIFTEAIMIKLI